MLESIQSLRRHYPDQVRGYVLSLFTLSRQGRHPFVIRGKNTAFFDYLFKNFCLLCHS